MSRNTEVFKTLPNDKDYQPLPPPPPDETTSGMVFACVYLLSVFSLASVVHTYHFSVAAKLAHAILVLMDTLRRLKVIFRAAVGPIEPEPDFEKFDETISPNMRALRLSMTIAEILTAMGVSVADIVSMALDITDRYCKRKVQFDISSTLITASQDRGNDREPLTLVRHAKPRTPNSMTIQSLQELVREIQHGKLTLEAAETKLEKIIDQPQKYPYWLTTIGGALISTGVGIMYGAGPLILIIMFTLAAIVTYSMRVLVHRRVPTFFAQIFASILITLIAAVVTLANRLDIVPWIHDVNATLIVIGGIVMLVAGLAIVSAVQDAIDEFYVTANARLLKVIMLTIGIVAGVLIGLYIAKRLGVTIAVQSDLRPVQSNWQILGIAMISGGYALNMQSRPFGIISAGLMGALAWLTYQAMLAPTPLGPAVASATAAAVVGVCSTLISRWWRTPSTTLMTAGIVPLVPGMLLFNGLLQLVGNAANVTSFNDGVQTLFGAMLIALAIASGVSFGHLVARPIRRSFVRARNALPTRE